MTDPRKQDPDPASSPLSSSATPPVSGRTRHHQKVRETLKVPAGFVLHSLRHTMLTRLGEAGVDAFTIMRIAGHSSIAISQRYVHPSTQAMENGIPKLEPENAGLVQEVGTTMGNS